MRLNALLIGYRLRGGVDRDKRPLLLACLCYEEPVINNEDPAEAEACRENKVPIML